MNAPTRREIVDGFARCLKPDDPTLIECRCQYCGFLLIGSASEGLHDYELQHRNNCPPDPSERFPTHEYADSGP